MSSVPQLKPSPTSVSGKNIQQLMLMMAKHKPFKIARKQWFASQYLSVSIIISVGTLVSAIVFFSLRQWQITKLQTQLQQQVDIVTSYLQKNTNTNLEPLVSVNDFYNASTSEVSRQEFTNLAKRLLIRHPSIEILSWTPRISNSARPAFEAAIRNEGYKNYQISEQKTPGIIVRASVRSEYFPIT